MIHPLSRRCYDWCLKSKEWTYQLFGRQVVRSIITSVNLIPLLKRFVLEFPRKLSHITMQQ